MYIDTKLERQPSGHDGHYISWAFCRCLWDHSAPSRTDVASYLGTSALVAVEAWRQHFSRHGICGHLTIR